MLFHYSSDSDHEESLRQLTSNTKSLEDSVRKGGIKGLLAITKHNLDKWETEQVNIGVTGRPGVGKSTLINTIRGDVQPHSGVYAPVGHRETTDLAAPYPHPDNKNLVFWDLPGAGTDNFPRKTYITDKRVNFCSYDIYIIIASDRFTEDETWLAGEIQKLGKTFLFVRTKVDVEIYNEKIRMKSKADQQKTVQEIRDDCKQKLKAFKGFDETRDLYLIGSLQPTHPLLDFDKLCSRLVNALPALKGDALLYSLNFMAPEILEAKANALRKRIWRICVLSCMSGAVPIPGVSLVVDAALIAKEVQFYRKQFGLTTADLQEVAELVGISVDEMALMYKIKWFKMSLTSKDIRETIENIDSEIEVGRFMMMIIPVIGSIVGGTISYLKTAKILNAILKGMEAEAYQVLEILQEHTRNVSDSFIKDVKDVSH